MTTNNTDGAALLPVTLKPCPFTGQVAKGPTPQANGYWRIYGGSYFIERPTEALAIAAWNTRAPLPATQEDAERSGMGLFDIEPNLAESSREPSLRRIVRKYYNDHFNAVRAEELTTAYFKALSTPAMSDRQEYDGEAVREALERIEATIEAAERCMNASPFWDDNSRYAGKALLDYPRAQIAHERAALAHPAQARDEMREGQSQLPIRQP